MEKFKLQPPIPIGFKVYENPQDGLFIRNTIDSRIFKWISTNDLDPNGLDRNGNCCTYGRRCFSPLKAFDESGFEDHESEQFEFAVKKHGGFYISVDKFPPHCKSEAEHYAKKYLLGSIDAVSALPSREAFDCLFEHIYENFRAYVLAHQKNGETPYDAWNRISEMKKYDFYQNGIYGIKGLMDGKNEHTSEQVIDGNYCIYRGEYRMNLFAYGLEQPTNLEEANWFLARREFCEKFYAYFGYRVMILPR